MTGPQRTAIDNPCTEADETANPIYHQLVVPRWSYILTVNSGFE